MIAKIFPFILWLRGYRLSDLRIDFLAGITVALVLIPQSMAYAQLAGLPAYYGLYAAFLPPMIAALFGSSRQLATGPVAVVSLMTSASLAPLATTGSAAFIAYAILLAFMVGLFQFGLGLLRLGLVVNFLSHPVVNGFTNAAAIIIASSQLSKMFGVTVDSAEHHYETIVRVVVAASHYIHWPTLAMGLLAFVIMYGLRRISPKIPNVLVAVVVTTVLSWAIGFQQNLEAPLGAIEDQEARRLVTAFNQAVNAVPALAEPRRSLSSHGSGGQETRSPGRTGCETPGGGNRHADGALKGGGSYPPGSAARHRVPRRGGSGRLAAVLSQGPGPAGSEARWPHLAPSGRQFAPEARRLADDGRRRGDW